jgi:hypothetical protein
VDGALCYLDVTPGSRLLSAVAKKVWGWKDLAGKGAGAPVDVTSPSRRTAAKAMEAPEAGRGEQRGLPGPPPVFPGRPPVYVPTSSHRTRPAFTLSVLGTGEADDHRPAASSWSDHVQIWWH